MAKSHGHVMVLGGNVPDKFLEHLLLESKENTDTSSSDDTHLNDSNRRTTGCSSEDTLNSTNTTQIDEESTQLRSDEKSKAA